MGGGGGEGGGEREWLRVVGKDGMGRQVVIRERRREAIRRHNMSSTCEAMGKTRREVFLLRHKQRERRQGRAFKDIDE